MQSTKDAIKITPEMDFLLKTNPRVQREFAHFLNGPKSEGYGLRASWEYVRVIAHPYDPTASGGTHKPRGQQPNVKRAVSDALILDAMQVGEWYSTKQLGDLAGFDYRKLMYLLSSLHERGYVGKQRGNRTTAYLWTKLENPVWNRDAIVNKLLPPDKELLELIETFPDQTSRFYSEQLAARYPEQLMIVIYSNVKSRLARLSTRCLVIGTPIKIRGKKAKLWKSTKEVINDRTIDRTTS